MKTVIVDSIQNEIVVTFNGLYCWFNTSSDLATYRPKNQGWSISQNLEHVYLTNHFLLMLIKKATQRSIELADRVEYKGFPDGYEIDKSRLDAVGKHGSFSWMRPEHMEPQGILSLAEVNNRLHQQQAECSAYLRKLANGEGVLYKTMMSVNNIGKIDVYHYIVFLLQHIKRHLQQMDKITLEFDQL